MFLAKPRVAGQAVQSRYLVDDPAKKKIEIVGIKNGVRAEPASHYGASPREIPYDVRVSSSCIQFFCGILLLHEVCIFEYAVGIHSLSPLDQWDALEDGRDGIVL